MSTCVAGEEQDPDPDPVQPAGGQDRSRRDNQEQQPNQTKLLYNLVMN